MCLAKELTEIIWKNHKIKEKIDNCHPKAEIMGLLRIKEMSENEIKIHISTDNERACITVLRAMLGNNGYKKTLGRRLNGDYYILEEIKATIMERIMQVLIFPMKSKDIVNLLPEFRKDSVKKILSRESIKDNKIKRHSNGYYEKIEYR